MRVWIASGVYLSLIHILTMSAAEYRLAKAALNQLRTQRLAEGGYTDAVDDALTRLLHAHTPLFLW